MVHSNEGSPKPARRRRGKQTGMSFEGKCAIIGDLWLYYRKEASSDRPWHWFFDVNDIALPLAYMVSIGLVKPTDDTAEGYVNETWGMFCEFIEIDPEGEYENLAAAFHASSRPPLHTPDGKKTSRKGDKKPKDEAE